MALPLANPIWIDTPAALQRMADTLLQQTIIAVDTESNSLFAYHEQVCLLQFSTATTDYLVDPIALMDLSPLEGVFASPDIEKVFHAAEYDLICLKRDFAFVFTNLFDTMLAARILGKATLGLGAILEERFAVRADKRLQRANWASRPLTAEMMAYARMDTHFLIPLRNILKEELIQNERMTLAQEDFLHVMRVPAGSRENGAGNWWRISGAQDLSPRQAAVLLELCAFRESKAQAMDQPPFRVMSNQTLLELAQRMPRKRSDLNQVYGLTPKLLDRYSGGLLAAVERGIVGAPAYRPPVLRHSDAELLRFESLRNWRKSAGHEMGVESDIILPRDLLEVIAERAPQTIPELQEVMRDFPWRFDHFGAQIFAAVALSAA